jgi:hypothetical protein
MTRRAVDLRAEAMAEAVRLRGARRLTRDGDGAALAALEGDAPWIALTSRATLRQSLGRRACLIWRIPMCDATGRQIESRIVGTLVDVPHAASRPARRTLVRSLVREADERVRACIEAASAAWRDEGAAAAVAFAAARERRERAIAARASVTGQGVVQTGLFDRRVERRRQAQAAADGEFESTSRRRLNAIDASTTIVVGPARLLLVLAP